MRVAGMFAARADKKTSIRSSGWAARIQIDEFLPYHALFEAVKPLAGGPFRHQESVKLPMELFATPEPR
jgi:hypothetical protein